MPSPSMPPSAVPAPPTGPSDPRATSTPGEASVIAMFGNGACWEPGGSASYGPAMGDPFEDD